MGSAGDLGSVNPEAACGVKQSLFSFCSPSKQGVTGIKTQPRTRSINQSSVELCHIKFFQTWEVRAVAGGRGRCSCSFVSLMPLDPWTCSVPSNLAGSLKKQVFKVTLHHASGNQRTGIRFFQLGTVFLIYLEIL